MNLIGAIYAVRRYGLKGIVEYIQRPFRQDSTARFLRDRTLSITPKPGITIIGNFDQPFSLSKTLRDFAYLLKESHIPFQALNIPEQNPIPASEYSHLLTPQDDFISNRYSHVITMRKPCRISDRRCTSHVIEFWEFEDGFKEEHPEVLHIKNIIAMSDFNRDAYQKQLPHANIRKVLYPFQFRHTALSPTRDTRQKYGIPADSFMVFFNFAFQSSYFRKNPEGILQAFRKCFAPSDKACIVFKTMKAKKYKDTYERLLKLAQELRLDKQLIIIDDFIPQEDLVNLTNACDVYMSLHRGEGFGIGIAEAMSLRKPVIVTDYSSTTEFCNPDNALPVPYRMIPVLPEQIDTDTYWHVTQWADPDIDAAADALRQLYEKPELRIKIGSAAKCFIDDYFSVANFKKSVEAFLGCSF